MNAAGSGVSTAIVQFAVAAGATVIGTAGGAEKVAKAIDLGCAHAIDHYLGYRAKHVAEEQAQAEVKTPESVADGAGGSRVDLPDADTCRELLGTMALIRRFEEEAGRQYQQAKAGGFLHLAIGEEATIVGTTSVMRPEDYLIGTYRTHGHAIARGTDPKRVMAELFGREDGMLARPRRLDAHLRPRAAIHGRLRDRRRQPAARRRARRSPPTTRATDAVTVCMFGDGASNTGNFGETMNLAALWRLPVVFLVENNLYGMGTSIERHSAVTDLSRKAEGSGVPGVRVDGMDVLAVRETVAEHIRDRARGAPADPGRGLHLPLPRPLRGRPRGLPREGGGRGVAQEGPGQGLPRPPPGGRGDRRGRPRGAARAGRARIVIDAVEFADNSPEPPLESLYDHLYVVGDQVPGWYAVDERTPEPHRGEKEREVGAEGEAAKLAEAGAAYAGAGSSPRRRDRRGRPSDEPERRPQRDEDAPRACQRTSPMRAEVAPWR